MQKLSSFPCPQISINFDIKMEVDASPALSTTAVAESANSEPTESKPVQLKFRNYTPHDPNLKKFVLKFDDDAIALKKQLNERFEALSSPEAVSVSFGKIIYKYYIYELFCCSSCFPPFS